MKTRIAPTPSGFLHAGNGFNFLVTDGLARALGMTLILRIDDLDAERTRPEYVEDIFVSLDWLGIRVDEGPSGPRDLALSWSQGLRVDRYMGMVADLRSKGAVYACACSRTHMEELLQLGLDHPCRAERGGVPAQGVPWRLGLIAGDRVAMTVLGGASEVLEPAALMPDPVILQRGGAVPAYQVASLCDDLEMGIGMIIRGADLLPSTACQLYIAQVLNEDRFRAVRFHHHPLDRAADGSKLSKSAGAASLKAMRESGVSPGPLIARARLHVDTLLARIQP